MSNQVQLRRGTTLEHTTFTGAEGEITVDTTKNTLVVHDGLIVGGIPLAKESSVPTDAEKSKWNSKSIAFYIDDILEVDTNLISVIVPIAMTIKDIRLSVDTAPTGAAILIDLNKNGTTLYTTQANLPTIAIDGTSATATLPDIVTLAIGDKLTLDIDQVGSTVAGENLSVIVICEVQ